MADTTSNNGSIQLTPATINGLLFYIETEAYNSQEKIKKQNYTGSDGSYIQGLGSYAAEYDIAGFFTGEDAVSKIKQLQQIKDSGATVPLVLPILQLNANGIITVVSFAGDIQKYNRIDVTFRFIEQTENKTLAKTNYTPASIPLLTDATIQVSQNFMASNFQAPSGAIQSGFAKSPFSQFNSLMNKISNSSFNSAISSMQQMLNKIDRLIQIPAQLANAYNSGGVWGLLSSAISLDPSVYQAMQPLCLFGNTLATTVQEVNNDYGVSSNPNTYYAPSLLSFNPIPNQVTQIDLIPVANNEDAVIANNNTAVIVATTRINAFACLCSQACQISYETETQIDTTIAQLTFNYQVCLSSINYTNQDGVLMTSLNGGSELLTALSTIMNETLAILQSLRDSVFEVKLVKVDGTRSLVEYTYANYANLVSSTDEFEELMQLISSFNSTQNMLSLTGDTEVLVVA